MAPWALLFGVLLRVAVSVPSTVQLPAVVGGRASLNLLCAFAGRSGAGKGNASKVSALAWPTGVETLLLGSGQGIAAVFVERQERDENVAVLFDVQEIDMLTGLSSAQGSILLPTIKSLAMGEQLGQTNAAKQLRRNVAAHSYRACLSVGAQPGHTTVLFADTTGGTPQRFLWAPTTDPNAPDGEFTDPEPLATTMPLWEPGPDGVTEIVYATPEISATILDTNRARLRGNGEALDGHAVLTRCKVAALLAIMHGRGEVTEWDWRQSAVVMAVSDETRLGLLRAGEDIERQRALDAGKQQAYRREGYEVGMVVAAKRAIVARLRRQPGGMPRNQLRTSLTSSHRAVFDEAVGELVDEHEIEVVRVRGGERYHLTVNRQGGDGCQGSLIQVTGGGDARQGGDHSEVISLESRRSKRNAQGAVSCRRWFDQYFANQIAAGNTTVDAVAGRQAAMAAGYSRNSIDVELSRRRLKGKSWSLTGLESSEREATLAV
ncbi:hypothetical protein [Mycolicibacterium iranicum]|uniref:hypothetical protein n=1 Tax=Mycolicibacterium iranicum TaxID=912594 RepID=UPI0013A55FE5|nr:hypothetical protein [Mycolicibacterium iranicum]